MADSRQTRPARADESTAPPGRPSDAQAELEFNQRLKAIVEVSNELSKAHSLDAFCRMAVELGQQRVGFDRLAIWLLSEDQEEFVGTFGTDEEGRIRDERGHRRPVGQRGTDIIRNPTPTARTRFEGPLMAADGRVLTQGQHVAAAMMDGRKVLGFLDMDNLLKRRSIDDRECELLGLYASSLAYLWSRIQAEHALRESDRAEKQFRERLAALVEVGSELSRIDSFDELCRRAVELGRTRLGFDRLGIWFDSEDGRYYVGTYGTDERGQIRDERDVRIPVEARAEEQAVGERLGTTLRAHLQQLRDHRGEVIGRGIRAWATIQDGERVIGSLCTDNLLEGGPISDQTCEVLAMYASVLGHLCSRQRAEEAHLAQVRNLTADAEKSLEEERARISKELHDELGQLLTALNMNLAWVDEHLGGDVTRLKDRVREAKDHVDRVVQTLRHIVRSLRPQLLDYHGLMDALRVFVSEFEQHAGIACWIRSDPPDLTVGEPPAMTIFRIVQEALTNVARHAGATECEVCVESRGGMLEVRVTDNGRGGELAALSGARSLGIIGMKERAAALGGMVRVENGQKGGVRVTARIPWSPAPDGE